MSVRYKGVVYWYVDTICVDEIVYDIYEDDLGNVIYRVIGTTEDQSQWDFKPPKHQL